MPRDADDDRWADDDLPDPVAPLTPAQLKRAKARVFSPVALLVIHGALGLLGAVYGLTQLAVDPVAQMKQERAEAEANMTAQQRQDVAPLYDALELGVGYYVKALPVLIGFGLVFDTLVLIGAVSLLKFSSRGLAKLGAGLACLPCFGGCCLIGLGGGVWSFAAMRDPDVVAAFAAGGKLPFTTDGD